MLALKLVLGPVLLLGVTLAGRRWGPEVAGWLAALPLVVAPILALLVLERGMPFAADAAAAPLLASSATMAFVVAYAHAAPHGGWPRTLAVGIAVWGVAVLALSRLPESLPPALGVALAALLLGPRACRRRLPRRPADRAVGANSRCGWPPPP